jgi:hypothetical protein
MSTITGNDAERRRAALERQPNTPPTVLRAKRREGVCLCASKERIIMQPDAEKLNFDVRRLSTWTPGRGGGSPVSLTTQQKRQLRSLPKQGQATLLVLSRNSCVVVALYVRPWINIASKYVIEPAFDEDDYDKPLTVDGVIDRMVRLIVANGVKPSSIVFEPAWNGMDGAQYGMLRLVQRAAMALGELLTTDVRELELDMRDRLDRQLLSLVFLAKGEAEAFVSKAVRNALDIIADHNSEVFLQCCVVSDDPVARAILEARQSLRRIS